ncbi:ubiquitin carboxyl-terminal hydrolase MINDY-2-like [Gigantopelta aegis]|uniref:ubiquitin carboxyl-terminal hydrolase MINDY-2-like n=1 Tax=Gigantopelta aegis TaxID=1735272 RepID=UPI001B88ADEF|nr:ubiquitin carboxyl-terminal hydrolase MINDY-2-like [Gigantopelta aegis]
MASPDGSGPSTVESGSDQMITNPSRTTCNNPAQVLDPEGTAHENLPTNETTKPQGANQQSGITEDAEDGNRSPRPHASDNAMEDDSTSSHIPIVEPDSSSSDKNNCCEHVSTETSDQLSLESNSDLIKLDDVMDPDTSDSCQSQVVELPPLDSKSGKTSSRDVCGSSSLKDDNGQCVYYIKWISFNSNKVPIITQNENGPCPLLAIMNALLLKGKVKLAPMIEMITSEQLMTYLGDCILESMPENLSENVRANFEQNMQDAMSVMYKLQTGIDVNVKFTGVKDFEYTPECIIFDLLEMSLYHGWLVDPQDHACVKAVGLCSYNQLVEKIIAQKSSDKPEEVHEALVAEQFLDRTAAQLTYYGLCELVTTVKENELAVFFRNNHFCTLYKHNNELFLLITDQGFLTECSVVWETLSNVEGDCHFVDTNFRTYTKPEPSPAAIAAAELPLGSDQQIDQDYQVALSLQQEVQLRDDQANTWGPEQEQDEMQMADHELARKLQEEEDRRAAAAAANSSQQRSTQGHSPSAQGHGHPSSHSSNSARPRHDRDRREREREKDDKCIIL